MTVTQLRKCEACGELFEVPLIHENRGRTRIVRIRGPWVCPKEHEPATDTVDRAANYRSHGFYSGSELYRSGSELYRKMR